MPRPRELPDRARVVIVGGGVGGTSIAYHLAQLGERDVVLVDRAELTSGSTFHSAGLVGQLRGSVSLTRMMMDSVELYRRLGDACGWVECGGLRLACTPEREEELHRQVGWSRTFGLPLELLSADEAAALFPLMSTDGVRAASYLPTDGYLDPSQLTYALAEGAREGGCRIYTHTRVTGIDVDAGARARRADRVGRRSRPRSSSTPAACSPPRSAAWPACASRWCPSRTSTSSPSRSASATASHLPTLRDPDLLVYYREEGGGLVMGGYERRSAPWSLRPDGLDAIAPDFNGHPARGGLGPLRGDRGQLAQARAGDGGREGHAADQRARGASPPTTSSCWARARCAASSSPPASAPTGWPAPAAWARRWPSGSWPASRRWTCGRWTSGASARTTARRATRSSARARSTRPTTTSSTPATSAQAGRPLRVSSAYALAPRRTARPSARSPAGSG